MKKLLAVILSIALFIAVPSIVVTANDTLGEVPIAKGISIDGVKDAVYNDGLILNYKEDMTGTGAVIYLLWEPGWLYAFGGGYGFDKSVYSN